MHIFIAEAVVEFYVDNFRFCFDFATRDPFISVIYRAVPLMRSSYDSNLM